MIPKIIHYCWFGGQKMPADYQKYIKEWSEANPGYKIMRWDESNSPMKLSYLKKAKANKKWANMSKTIVGRRTPLRFLAQPKSYCLAISLIQPTR